MIVRLVALCSLLLLPLAAGAQPSYQSHDEIYARMVDFVHNQLTNRVPGRVSVKPGHIDPRLKLSACSQPIQIFIPVGSELVQTNTLGVRCDGEIPWKIHVPINIKVMGEVLVAKRPLRRGHVIQATDLHKVELDISKVQQQFYQDPAAIIGKAVDRPLRTGMVIGKRYITLPIIINKGETVTITAKRGNLRVSMKGVALQDGIQGRLLNVRNMRSGKVLQAVAKGPQEVEISL